jgi:tRNA A-37 threonylcarbamoyl transferase component Bud32
MINQSIKFVNKGTFGCIYHPNIHCDKKHTGSKYVSKIQLNTTTLENEINIGNIIKNEKNYDLYFSPIINSCPINVSKVNKDEIKKCDLLKYKIKNYSSNTIRYVGKKDLHDYLYSNIDKFIPVYEHLLEALCILEKMKIVHYDIKSNNILFDDRFKVPIIIDFGISFDLPDMEKLNLYEIFYSYSNDYEPWCIDICVESYIQNNIREYSLKINKEDVEMLINNYITENPLFNYLSEKELETWKNNNTEYFSKFIGKSWNILSKELLNYLETWDNYSITVLFLHFLLRKKPLETKYINYFKKILISAPDKRPTAMETKKHIQSFKIKPKIIRKIKSS